MYGKQPSSFRDVAEILVPELTDTVVNTGMHPLDNVVGLLMLASSTAIELEINKDDFGKLTSLIYDGIKADEV